MKTKERYFPEGSVKIKDDKLKIECAIYKLGDKYAVLGYSGRKSKHDFHNSFKNLAAAEIRVGRYIEQAQDNFDANERYKAIKKLELKLLKESIIPGSLVRTSFSYNMTFNYFYKVISKKGDKVQLECLTTEWVSGDIGYTGQVTGNGETGGTGVIIEGKFTASGLKIKDQYARVYQEGNDFYQNHLD